MVIGNGVIGLFGEGTDKSCLSDEALDAGISNEPLGLDVNILFMRS